MIGLFAAVLSFGGVDVARAATDPLSGLPCAELSGDTQPFIDANGYMNSGAMYFGQYKAGRPTTSAWWAGFNITKPVYYAPAGSTACVTEKDGKAYLQGWVWNDNIGWISLYCPPTSLNRGVPCGPITYGVQIAPIPGSNPAEWVFSGYAWGNAGWIRMNCDATSGYGDSSYCATSKHAVTLDYGLKMVKVAAYDWVNPTALTPTTGKAWAWTSGLQWLSFGGMKVPLGACANPALCDSDDATFVTYEGDVLVAKKMVPNQEATVSVTMKNSGTLTWVSGPQPDKGHYMLLPDPAAAVWQVPSDPNPAIPGQLQMITNSVIPGKSKTFTFKIKAPAVKGTYSFQWQMKKDSAPGLFGQKSDLVQIVVDDAAVKKVGPFGNPGEFLTAVREPVYINSSSGDSTVTTTPSTAINPVTPAQIRNLVYRNVQKWKKVASTSCGQNGSLLLQNESSKDEVYYCKGDVNILPGKWTGNKTIIVDGGNVHILGSLYSTKGQLGIIALRSKLSDPSQGNVYVYPDVRDLRVQIYADGSVYPVVTKSGTDTAFVQSNGSPSVSALDYKVAPGNTLFGQLYIQGMIISNNSATTGGDTGDEQLKSLGYLRSVPTDPESGAPLSWNDYFDAVSAVKGGTFTITDPDAEEVSSVKYTGYPVNEEKGKRKSANYTPDVDHSTYSVFINYEPPAQNLPGFDGIVGGGVKQTGGQ
ncbi:hypothetical protein KAZ92_01130 [Candidatus Gracilibacteria bacterium]|nr:hypothetical protein [Candidatus Gracilibacteria bacterium]